MLVLGYRKKKKTLSKKQSDGVHCISCVSVPKTRKEKSMPFSVMTRAIETKIRGQMLTNPVFTDTSLPCAVFAE